MNLDEQDFPIITSYSQDLNRMNVHHQPLPQDHIIRHTPRQYSALSKFQNNYNPPPSILQNTQRYPETSRTIKEEQDLITYPYSPTDFRGEINVNVHHPIHPDQNTIRYHPSHNLYPSDLDNPNTGGLPMSIGMNSSRLESSEAPLVLEQAKTGSTDFRYQMRALQPQQPQQQHQRHPHGPLPHHQQQNPDLHHMQASPAFFSLSMGYSSLDQEHSSSSGGALDRQPQSQLSSVEYDPMESHAQHVSVPAMVYGALSHEPTTVPGHSQQGVRHDATLNHRGSLASMKGKNPGTGSYHTSNSPSSIPMSNNKHNHGTTPSMSASVPGVHTSSSFSMGPSNSSRWVGHPLSFGMVGSSSGATSVHGQVPTLSSTPAPASGSSSLRPTLHHPDSGNRSSPENSFAQLNSRLHASTSARTLSSSQSTHSHTSTPSPRLSDNESTLGGRGELVSTDDRESDQAVDTNETVVQMSEKSSAGKKKVIGAGEEVGESFLPPIKKKKKSKMHRCVVCGKKFPRPSGLKTHMNTHNNEKPYPCGFPGCTRTFGVRSNAKRHLRTHGVFPTPVANPSSTDYVVGFCPPMILATQSSSHQQSQLHSVEGGDDFNSSFRLLGDNGNIHAQDQGKNDVQHEMNHVPLLKLRWMPPSLTTRTNAGSLREVRDGQQAHRMGECADEDGGEDEDDFVGGRGIRHIGRSEYNMKQGDMDDGVGEGDNAENMLRPIAPSLSSGAVATSSPSTRLRMSCPAGCMCSPPCAGPSIQGRRRSSYSSSGTFTSMSPIPSRSFHRSNSSLSPSSMSAYTQREIELTGVGGAYTRARTNSEEYDIRETTAEEQDSYLEGGSHPYHPSQFHALPGPSVVNPTPPATTVLFSRGKEVRYPLVS